MFQEVMVEEITRNVAEALKVMVADVEDRDITTDLVTTTISSSIIRPSHTVTTPPAHRTILLRQPPTIRINLLLINGVPIITDIMRTRMRLGPCRQLRIQHTRSNIRQPITLPHSSFHMRPLNTTHMVHRRLRTHLSGMGRGSRIILVADLAADFMTRTQGVLHALQMVVVITSHTHLIYMPTSPLNIIRMEVPPQYLRACRTTKTRSMGSTRVAVVEGTEMAAIVAEVAITMIGAKISLLTIPPSTRMIPHLLARKRSARRIHSA